MECEDLTEIEKYILLLAGANDSKPIRGNTWLQKEMFLISKNNESLNQEASFESDFYGPFSDNISEEVDELKMNDFLVIQGGKIQITNDGRNIFLKLKKSIQKDEMEMIEYIKSFLNDLPEDELLAFIYFTYPNMAEESLVKKKIEKKRVELALSLFRKEKISMEKAAEISGLPLESFVKHIR